MFFVCFSLLKLRNRTESIHLIFTIKEKVSLERTFKGFLVQTSDESSAKFAVRSSFTARSDCPGNSEIEFWISPRMEIPTKAALPLFSSKTNIQQWSTGPQWASEEKAAAIWFIAIEITAVLAWRGLFWYSDTSRQSIACLVVTVVGKDQKRGKVWTKRVSSRSLDRPGGK